MKLRKFQLINLIFLSTIIAFGTSNPQSIDNHGSNESMEQIDLQAITPDTHLAEMITGPVAVFKDRDYGNPANVEILELHGIEYQVLNSTNIGSADLSIFEKVIIRSGQEASFNSLVLDNKAYFEDYASNGGTLQIHAPYSGLLPGNLQVILDVIEEVFITAPEHRVFNVPNLIDSFPLRAGGVLENLSYDAEVLLYGGPNDRGIGDGYNTYIEGPVMVEQVFGAGTILTTTVGPECLWEFRSTDGSTILENLIIYKPGAEVVLPPTSVAIFKDNDPWSTSANEIILSNNEIGYDLFNSTDIGIVALNSYAKTIIVSDQSLEFNNAVLTNRIWFEDYVRSGGILQINAATNSMWDHNLGLFPGGLEYMALSGEGVAVLDPQHTLFNIPNAVTELSLNNWGLSYHGIITALQQNATIHLEGFYLPPMGMVRYTDGPILVEQPLGNGIIIMSTQALERGFSISSEFVVNFDLYLHNIPTQVAIWGSANESSYEFDLNLEIQLSWYFEGIASTEYNLYLDDIIILSGPLAAFVLLTYDFSPQNIGDYEFKFQIQSPAGYLNTSKLIHIVDTTLPEISGLSYVAINLADTAGFLLQWNVFDLLLSYYEVTSTVGDVAIQGNLYQGQILELGSVQILDLLWNINEQRVLPGEYILTITVFDTSNNSVSLDVTLVIIGEVMSPTDPSTSDASTAASSITDSSTTDTSIADSSTTDPSQTDQNTLNEDGTGSDTPSPSPFNSILILVGLLALSIIKRRK